jgi:hypothetical protein
MQTRLALALFTTLAVTRTAAADTYSHKDMEQLGSELHDVAPEPGVAKAPARAPAWCRHVTPESGYTFGGFEQAIENAKDPLRAARIACSFPGNEPGVQRAAAIIEQRWINNSGLSDADAVLSIAARLDDATFKADKQRLCSALVEPEEAQGEAPLYVKTQRRLFGCGEDYAAWEDDQWAWPDELPAYLDQSAHPADPLVRLGFALERAKPAFEDPKLGNQQKHLAPYGVDSYDFHTLARAEILKQFDTPPYQGNAYAKVVAIESLARAQMGVAILDHDAQALAAKDKDWKELLIDAPARGAAAYLAAAKPYAAELARSNTFEYEYASGSAKRVAGCEAPLRADFLSVFGKLPHHTFEESVASLSDPIAGLLLQRLITCIKVTGDQAVAKDLGWLRDRDVRYSRGPRTAIYYAQLEALAKITKDRPRFPFAVDRFSFAFRTVGDRGASGSPRSESGKGVVKSVTKKAGSVHVVFVTQKTQTMSRTCVDTDRLIQIRGDGSLQWEQHCHDGGWVTIDITPEPTDVPAAYAAGIAAGGYLELTGDGFPMAVYTDKSKKKLVNFYGFAL